jgi:hypothetical protein
MQLDLRRIGFIGLSLVCVSFCIKTVGSYTKSNIGLIVLLNSVKEPFCLGEYSIPKLQDVFQKAKKLGPGNTGANRGLGFVHWYMENDKQALNEWRQADLNAQDYVVFGQYANDVPTSLRWYKLAEIMDPADPELWLQVGQICQKDPSVSDVCKRYLAHNDYDWLVDSGFTFDRAAWRFNRREGAEYAIMGCPGVAGKKCAMVEIDEVTSPHGTGWVQCLTLEPGQAYRFSAWVKVETEGEWIPIYYQGAQDGDPHGIKLGGSHTGAQDWTYFEQEFVAPEFDEDRACFHPARLLDVGQLWFHSATLRVVE